MLTFDFDHLELPERGPGLRATFPISSAQGTADLAVVVMEIEPGGMLLEHTDSAEELLFVVEGEVEASVGDEIGTLAAGQAAVVPALAAHGLRNLSDRRARLLGVFASSTNVAVFTDPIGPNGEQVFVVGTPEPVLVPTEAPLSVA
jgi:quercetin dioxygenase-like cupin family protein